MEAELIHTEKGDEVIIHAEGVFVGGGAEEQAIAGKL